MKELIRPNSHMAMMVTGAKVYIGEYTDFLTMYGRRLDLLYRGTLKPEDIPDGQKIFLLPIYGDTWIPVRFEPRAVDPEFNKQEVDVFHDGGEKDGKPFAFPDSPGEKKGDYIVWSTIVGKDEL